MGNPFRGFTRRLERKRDKQIRRRLEIHRMEDKSFKRNIYVYSEGDTNMQTDYIIVVLKFHDRLYSADDILEIVKERMGDIF